jgi:hypothetical protein
MLCSDRRCVVACVIAVGIAVGGVARNAEGWFQDSRQGNAVDEAKGQAALAEARQHMSDNRWRLAIGSYETALTYLPGNAEALAGVRTAQAELNVAPIISPVEEELRVQLGRAREEFRAATQRATQLLSQGDFNGAEREMLTGQIRMRQARSLLSQREFNQLNQQAESLLTEIDQRRETDRLEKAKTASARGAGPRAAAASAIDR